MAGCGAASSNQGLRQRAQRLRRRRRQAACKRHVVRPRARLFGRARRQPGQPCLWTLRRMLRRRHAGCPQAFDLFFKEPISSASRACSWPALSSSPSQSGTNSPSTLAAAAPDSRSAPSGVPGTGAIKKQNRRRAEGLGQPAVAECLGPWFEPQTQHFPKGFFFFRIDLLLNLIQSLRLASLARPLASLAPWEAMATSSSRPFI